MDSFPLEVMIRIFSFLTFDDKHVVMRVNQLWQEAAAHVISKQKRLILFPDDAADWGNVSGMSVKRLLVVFRTRLIHKLTGFTYLDMRTAVQHRYDDVEYDHTGATLLTKHQAASLLRQVAATVQILISSRCDVLNRISFPVLRVLTCTDSSAEDPLSHYVVQSCPMLLQLTVGHMDSKGLRELPGNMTLLRIESFEEEDVDPVRMLSRLRQLSLTADCVRIRQDFFANMHDLEIVNLTIYCVEEEEEEDDEEGELNVSLFDDEGVRILLHNNARLKDVTLSGFRLTSKSLEYFADYAEHHALERLAIKSSVCLADEDVTGLAEAGAKSKLQTLSILSDDPEQDRIITIRTFPDRMNTTT